MEKNELRVWSRNGKGGEGILYVYVPSPLPPGLERVNDWETNEGFYVPLIGENEAKLVEAGFSFYYPNI